MPDKGLHSADKTMFMELGLVLGIAFNTASGHKPANKRPMLFLTPQSRIFHDQQTRDCLPSAPEIIKACEQEVKLAPKANVAAIRGSQ